jgi:hypothetical protein
MLCVKSPNLEPCARNANDSSHPFLLRVEIRMSKQATNKGCCFILSDSQANQTMAAMTQLALVETQVTGEECRATLVKQEGDYLVVLHPLSAHIFANLTYSNAPAP